MPVSRRSRFSAQVDVAFPAGVDHVACPGDIDGVEIEIGKHFLLDVVGHKQTAQQQHQRGGQPQQHEGADDDPHDRQVALRLRPAL